MIHAVEIPRHTASAGKSRWRLVMHDFGALGFEASGRRSKTPQEVKHLDEEEALKHEKPEPCKCFCFMVFALEL